MAISEAGKRKVRQMTKKVRAKYSKKSGTARAAAKPKKKATLGAGMAERARKKVKKRRSRLDEAIKRAGG